MDELFLVGRILFSFIFIASGIAHFQHRAMFASAAKSKGVPNAEVGVLVSGVVIITGGLLVALGVFADIGALLIAAFLVSTLLTIHTFWKVKNPRERMLSQVHFNKDLAMLGAALIVFWIFNQVQDPPFTLTDALINRF